MISESNVYSYIYIAITIDLDGDRAYTDDAKVLVMDKEVDNGVIHIIDQIMMP